MDYGRLAYLRLAEIEAELAEKNTIKPISRTAFLDFDAIANAKIKLFKVNSSSFILNLSLSGGEIGSKIHLYANNKLISSQNYAEHIVFTVTFDEVAICELSLMSEQAVRVLKADILLLNGQSEDVIAGVALAKSGVQTALARVVNGQIRLHIFEGEIGDFVGVGFGNSVDIVPYNLDGEGCFAVIFSDFCGNAYLVFVGFADGIYRVLDSRLVAVDVDSVSICKSGDSLLVGYTCAGKAFVRSVFEFDGTTIDSCEVVQLVKDAVPPVAVISNDGNLSVKICEKELNFVKNIETNAQISVV